MTLQSRIRHRSLFNRCDSNGLTRHHSDRVLDRSFAEIGSGAPEEPQLAPVPPPGAARSGSTAWCLCDRGYTREQIKFKVSIQTELTEGIEVCGFGHSPAMWSQPLTKRGQEACCRRTARLSLGSEVWTGGGHSPEDVSIGGLVYLIDPAVSGEANTNWVIGSTTSEPSAICFPRADFGPGIFTPGLT